MILKYEQLTDDILEKLLQHDNKSVSELLLLRDELVSGIEKEGLLDELKKAYKQNGIKDKDIKILSLMAKEKEETLKEISTLNTRKTGNMVYATTFSKDISLFIAKA